MSAPADPLDTVEPSPAAQPTWTQPTPPLPTPPLRWADELLAVRPAVPASLPDLRHELADWLAGLGWPEPDADDVVLAANEAISNVIEHAYPDHAPGPVHLHAWTTHRPAVSTIEPPTRQARVAVTDHGRWDPEWRTVDPRGFRGHGMHVMTGCMAEIHLQRGGGGTTVLLVSAPVAAAAQPPDPDRDSSTRVNER